MPSSHEGDVFSSIHFFFIEKYSRKIKCLEISEERRYVDLEASGESCQMSSYHLKVRRIYLGNVNIYLADSYISYMECS